MDGNIQPTYIAAELPIMELYLGKSVRIKWQHTLNKNQLIISFYVTRSFFQNKISILSISIQYLWIFFINSWISQYAITAPPDSGKCCSKVIL